METVYARNQPFKVKSGEEGRKRKTPLFKEMPSLLKAISTPQLQQCDLPPPCSQWFATIYTSMTVLGASITKSGCAQSP
jgi:hypothetical protein